MKTFLLTLALLASLGANFFAAGYARQMADNNTALILENAQLVAEQSERERLVRYVKTKYARYVEHQAGTVIRLIGYVEDAAHEFNVDPRLLVAQMSAESAFDPRAVSYVGATGLMQVMPFWATSDTPDARQFREDTGITTVEQLRHPLQNLRAGAWIIANYIDKCGGIENGVRCYHGGYKALHRPRPSTLDYSAVVLKRYYSI